MAIAIGLAEAGADIVGVSKTLEPRGSAVERDVVALGRSFTGYQCDLADRAAVHDLVARVRGEHPVIDILVNNAGMVLRSPATEYPDEDWDVVLHTNLTAQFILAREFGRDMVERGTGKIIFTASLLAFQGGILVPAYAAAKGGVVQLAKAMANEWTAHGVQVNAIAPGYIATDNNQALRADPVRYAAITERIPAGRWGEPDDLKGVAVFLASRASDYVSGSVIVVDGGWLGR
jgi:2-deoxy-D-gluconate 3-dehydrogenase